MQGLGEGTLERDARRLAPLVQAVWRLFGDGNAAFGAAVGPGLELRAIPDYDAAGNRLLDAGGEPQTRYGLFVRGATGDYGAALLSGTAAQPDQPALLIPGNPPASSSDPGVAGELRYDAQYVYICVAAKTWRRAYHNTW